MKKILSLILVITLISGGLFSCNNNPKTDDDIGTTESNTEGGDAPAETTEADVRIDPELPEENFGGYKFNFLTRTLESDDWISVTPLELVAEAETGATINDAVYRRNVTIKERYNIDITYTPTEDEKAALAKAVNAGESTFDAVLMTNASVSSIVPAGHLINISELPYIDLSKPWWDPGVNSMSIANNNYLLGGDILILDNNATNGMLFNKDLLADLGLDLPYALANEGKWTMDKLSEYIRGVSTDLNGDNEITPQDDRWGLAVFNDTLHALLVSGGGTLALKDDNDIPYMSFNSPRNIDVIGKAMDIMYNKQDAFNAQSDIKSGGGAIFYDAFESGRVLFMWARMVVVERFRDIEPNFGILPLPKYDETQENYHSVVNPYTGALIGVPKSAEDLERVSIILEALCAESRYTLQPAYYEVAMQRKYTRDVESVEMLDIIFNSRVYDVGAIYSFSNIFLDFIALCAKSDRNIVSFYERKSGPMERAIAKLVEVFE